MDRLLSPLSYLLTREQRRSSMKAKMEANQASLAVIGIDIGKEVFHIVGFGSTGRLPFGGESGD